MATTVTIDHDRAIIMRVLDGVNRPLGIRPPVVEFKQDHSGDEAVYLTFAASMRVPLRPARLDEMTRFVREVERSLFEAGLSRIPYVFFSESR